MELNSAISRHLIYRAIYILTQLAAPGVRRGINPPARPGDYCRGHQRYRHQISRGRQPRPVVELVAARVANGEGGAIGPDAPTARTNPQMRPGAATVRSGKST